MRFRVETSRKRLLFAVNKRRTFNSNILIIGSGASDHMISNKGLLTNIIPMHTGAIIELADNSEIMGIGNGDLTFYQGDKVITLQDVRYVPDLAKNLISVSKLLDKGAIVIFDISRKLSRVNYSWQESMD